MRRIAIVTVFAIASVALTAGVGIASDQPDSRWQDKWDVSLFLETTACEGFAASSPLTFAGSARAAYSVWYGVVNDQEEGYAQINVTATDGVHSYRIHERYEYPRAYRWWVYGYATTVVHRDDGATMTGWSMFSHPDFFQPYPSISLGVWWIGTPTCALR